MMKCLCMLCCEFQHELCAYWRLLWCFSYDVPNDSWKLAECPQCGFTDVFNRSYLYTFVIFIKCILLYLAALICFSFASNSFWCVNGCGWGQVYLRVLILKTIPKSSDKGREADTYAYWIPVILSRAVCSFLFHSSCSTVAMHLQNILLRCVSAFWILYKAGIKGVISGV
jgi:hypothetical protein